MLNRTYFLNDLILYGLTTVVPDSQAHPAYIQKNPNHLTHEKTLKYQVEIFCSTKAIENESCYKYTSV